MGAYLSKVGESSCCSSLGTCEPPSIDDSRSVVPGEEEVVSNAGLLFCREEGEIDEESRCAPEEEVGADCTA